MIFMKNKRLKQKNEELLSQRRDMQNQLREKDFELDLFKNKEQKKSKPKLLSPYKKLKYLFNSHGIHDYYISSFIKEHIDKNFHIPISKEGNTKYVLNQLSKDNIQKVLNLFWIKKDWLYIDIKMYMTRLYTNNLSGFINFIHSRREAYDAIEVFAIKSEELDYKDKDRSQLLYLVVRAKIAMISNKEPIYRYYPIQSGWRWEYSKSRYQIKSIFNLLNKNSFKYSRIDVEGISVSKEELNCLEDKNFCPHMLLNKYALSKKWHPNDYVTKIDENSLAKEEEEFDFILDYIESNKLNEIITEKSVKVNKVE